MVETKQGHLYVISGPSGTGKGSICQGLVADENIVVSVSMTTRAPRDHETEGKSYYFVSKERFNEVLAGNGFYEHAEIYGEFYGTPKEPVERLLNKGLDVILEIDVKGAMQVKAQKPGAVLIFIMPPSPGELRRRIEDRGTETEERIARRLERSSGEIAQMGSYDYCVINDDLEKAIQDVKVIMQAEKFRVGDDVNELIERYHAGILVK